MPTRRRRKRNGDDEGGKPPDKGEERPVPRNPEADPVKIHRDYVERQLGGGAPATPEGYARAIEQWHKLPGAVRVPPTELTRDAAPPTPADEPDEKSTNESAS